jgi:hypothetical protein
MSKKIRAFLIFLGVWIFFSWGFRLYILTVRWETDPTRLRTLFFGLIYLSIGFFLFRLGQLGELLNRKNKVTLIVASLFMIGYWGVRLSRLFLYPDIDPNPRAHLHLSVTYIVLSCLLLFVAVKRDKKIELK